MFNKVLVLKDHLIALSIDRLVFQSFGHNLKFTFPNPSSYQHTALLSIIFSSAFLKHHKELNRIKNLPFSQIFFLMYLVIFSTFYTFFIHSSGSFRINKMIFNNR